MRKIYPPMQAREVAEPFSSPDWFFEIKWDGIRAICYTDGTLSLLSRYGNELAPMFPELGGVPRAAPDCVLDGEIVVMREGKPDIQPLLERLQRRRAEEIQAYAERSPVTYIIFDILERNGDPLIDHPLTERREILNDTIQPGDNIVCSVPVPDTGEAYFQAAVGAGLEGVMAKRKNSRYEPGRRSGNWLKIKKLRSIDAVVFGYTRGTGNRSPTFGALILGVYDGEKPVYIGKVGTGFSVADTARFTEQLAGLRAPGPTLKDADAPGKITWVRPTLVVEVAYQVITHDRRLRMPRFIHMRIDKLPRDCTIDQLEEAPEGPVK
ncbi:MAG: non-homologous end-joining DNA ligase [Methanomicrobiales archaeon]|nr:non-homologous end-joining DNA ligase [Methanomicrobiales archaeon]